MPKTLTAEQKARKACYSKIRRDIIKNHGVEAWSTMIATKAANLKKGDKKKNLTIISKYGKAAYKRMQENKAKAEQKRKEAEIISKYGQVAFQRMEANRINAENKRKEAELKAKQVPVNIKTAPKKTKEDEIISKYGKVAWIRMQANKRKAENKRKEALKAKQPPANIKTVPKANAYVTDLSKGTKSVKKRSKKRKREKTYQELFNEGQPTAEEIQRFANYDEHGNLRKKRYKPHDCAAAQTLYGENPIQGPDGKWYYMAIDKHGKAKRVHCS